MPSCSSTLVPLRNPVQAISVLRIGSAGDQSFQFHGGGINAAGRPDEDVRHPGIGIPSHSDPFQACGSMSGSLTDRVQSTGGKRFAQLLQTPSALFTMHYKAQSRFIRGVPHDKTYLLPPPLAFCACTQLSRHGDYTRFRLHVVHEAFQPLIAGLREDPTGSADILLFLLAKLQLSAPVYLGPSTLLRFVD